MIVSVRVFLMLFCQFSEVQLLIFKYAKPGNPNETPVFEHPIHAKQLNPVLQKWRQGFQHRPTGAPVVVAVVCVCYH